ncbi:MAG: RibD family protein [Chitinophagaceae bacterium]|nr:RibD family protein [Chitinophagaceae bacterium]
MKPYVICHMMCSVDGRILTETWGNPKGRSLYEPIGNRYKVKTWMSGRVTMERDFAGKRPLKLKPVHKIIPRVDHVADPGARSFAIAIDKDGKLNWQRGEIEGDHIIAVLSEQVSTEYLVHLQEKGISYIFGGKSELDFSKILNKLNKLFGIKKLMLEGGGGLNASFLRAGLIDELSVLYLPLADGTAGAPSLFDHFPDVRKKASKLRLLSVKKLQYDVLWTRYKVQ